MPGFESALAAGALSDGHVDAVAAALNGLDQATTAEFVGFADALLAHAEAHGPDEFAREARDLARTLSCDDGQGVAEAQRKQRRVKRWRALHGPAKEVFFAQAHEPGRLCASDFTHCSDVGVTIAGSPFPHLIYHFVLTYSNWEAGTVCFSESFESLSEGLQSALWELGGVPQVHRTDRLTAAVPPGAEA